mmetsp:Transcript_73731/g.170980  ORF Transcript_73731/g.170980 Transcript_73731/m.170980 type:complete len:81 (-) Transcript_73731:1073-1315(-)
MLRLMAYTTQQMQLRRVCKQRPLVHSTWLVQWRTEFTTVWQVASQQQRGQYAEQVVEEHMAGAIYGARSLQLRRTAGPVC